jgi:hypothetical protein
MLVVMAERHARVASKGTRARLKLVYLTVRTPYEHAARASFDQSGSSHDAAKRSYGKRCMLRPAYEIERTFEGMSSNRANDGFGPDFRFRLS